MTMHNQAAGDAGRRQLSPSRSRHRNLGAMLLLACSCLAIPFGLQGVENKPLRAGIIGLDTSHVLAFTKTLNKVPPAPEVEGVRVVAAYPKGSKDIESSTRRVPEYTKKVQALGVEIVDSLEELLKRVDVVILASNDGRVHLEQVRPVLKARKPVFIDKPIAGSLADTLRIFNEAKRAGVPLFCSSSLRFGKDTQAVRQGAVGKVTRAQTYSPVSIEPTHPDLYWYGVHGCEVLFAVMGTGCKSVQRATTTDGKIQVTGLWEDGRTGIFREQNGTDRKGYGGNAVGEKGEAKIGSNDGYDVLVFEIVRMFRSGQAPVSSEETTELYAFMEAADESKRRQGARVTLKEVMDKARAEVAAKP
jgi:predicted dehydrogenase